ncbi:uncharacterized protein RCC_01637 [Ramularia collo-cygni]|uniref:CSN8/PSMD8/EIF3K domain-containing protein n=1 Tax=Ramularia collo-cygni TaxID=112498 RepID=A0A2D3V673_9PEZI|nr:uncharacterized protein RCC_01637 [Ramularia collo-cygni]CZT15803.1 uncharacterized protein RCC_01637 [Ramularia collo-cygni]
MAASIRPQPRRGPSGAWSRLKPVAMDALDVYGLPSKGEARLHEYKNQENYYTKIVERYMKFCASSNGGDDLEAAFSSLTVKDKTSPLSLPQPTPLSNPSSKPPLTTRLSDPAHHQSDLPNILLAMRKLREGILGSRRKDNFAQRAYMFIIHASILTKSWESYQPALLYLLQEIHPHTPLSQPEFQEFAGYRILDIACRQGDLLDALSAKSDYQHQSRKVTAVLKALVQDDWVRFWRVKRAVDGYQRAIMEFAVDRMRLHALKCLGKSYMSADKAFVERSGDAVWEDLVKGGVGWQLQESTGSVVIRKPKPK